MPLSPTRLAERPYTPDTRDRLACAWNATRYMLTEPFMLWAARLRHGRAYRNRMAQPLVSIMLPTYKRATLMEERTLPSFLTQTYPNIEVVVLGDRALDNTAERIQKMNDPRIRFIHVPEEGIALPSDPKRRWFSGGAYQRNIGLAACRGEWIAETDDDDIFLPDHIESLLRFAQEGNYEFVSGAYERERHGVRDIVNVPDLHPRVGGIQTWLYRSYLTRFRYNYDSWRKQYNCPQEIDRQIRMHRAGVRMGFLDRVVTKVLPVPGIDTVGLEAREMLNGAVPSTEQVPAPVQPQTIADIATHAEALTARGDAHYTQLVHAARRSKAIAIFGAGEAGDLVRRVITDNGGTVRCFSDNDPTRWGSQKNGVPVVPPEQLRNWDGTVIVASWAEDAIVPQLKELGVAHIDTEIYVATLVQAQRATYRAHLNELAQVEALLADSRSKAVLRNLVLHAFTLDRTLLKEVADPEKDQYFSDPAFAVQPGETFIDGGAFNGDTVAQIVQRFGSAVGRIHCFEPNETNIEALTRTVQHLNVEDRVTIHPYGLSHATETIDYAGAGSSFHRAEPGETVTERIAMTTLDERLPAEKIHAIKMDIEGGEPQALRGMERIITSQKPRLSVCVYHAPEHLWEIPLWIHARVPNYQFTLRNHTSQRRETVLYARMANV